MYHNLQYLTKNLIYDLLNQHLIKLPVNTTLTLSPKGVNRQETVAASAFCYFHQGEGDYMPRLSMDDSLTFSVTHCVTMTTTETTQRETSRSYV